MNENKFDHKAIEDALAPTLTKALDVFAHSRSAHHFQFSLWTPEHKRYIVRIDSLDDGEAYFVELRRLSRTGDVVRKSRMYTRVTLAELPGIVRTLW